MNYEITRRTQTINDTKIKYLLVVNKIYEVTSINWIHSCLEAKETDLSAGDIEESGLLWDIAEFEDCFKIRLINGDGVAKVIDFREWVERHKGVRINKNVPLNGWCQRHGGERGEVTY